MKSWLFCFRLFFMSALTASSAAYETASSETNAQDTLPLPKGRVILTITGAISRTNVEETAQFDREMLLALGTHTLKTTTSWTDGVQVFEGVLASDIMRAVGNNGSVITATALNDYTVDIPVSDFSQYGVLFALFRNGKALTVRTKGPIWPVYPKDDFPELQDRDADKKWIYMLYKMDVR